MHPLFKPMFLYTQLMTHHVGRKRRSCGQQEGCATTCGRLTSKKNRKGHQVALKAPQYSERIAGMNLVSGHGNTESIAAPREHTPLARRQMCAPVPQADGRKCSDIAEPDTGIC